MPVPMSKTHNESIGGNVGEIIQWHTSHHVVQHWEGQIVFRWFPVSILLQSEWFYKMGFLLFVPQWCLNAVNTRVYWFKILNLIQFHARKLWKVIWPNGIKNSMWLFVKDDDSVLHFFKYLICSGHILNVNSSIRTFKSTICNP